MSEKLIVRHCSPTLAGLKTGSLFPCPCPAGNPEEILAFIRNMNRTLSKKGIRVVPMRFTGNNILIYLYRPARLKRDLCHPLACRVLTENGYTCGSAEQCVGCLMRRLREGHGNEDFPHEIGLFLGYPPEDVCGFIDSKTGHTAPPCKCTGCWKVYGDEVRAQKLFAQYKKCTAVYCAHHANGDSLDKLTVKESV